MKPKKKSATAKKKAAPKKAAPKRAAAAPKKAADGARAKAAPARARGTRSAKTNADKRSKPVMLRAEDYSRLETELGGWPAGVTTYRIGETWICKIDNVSPGALVARARAETREQAVSLASERASARLAATRRHG